MTSRTHQKHAASRRIVDGIGATFDRLSPAGRRGLCRSLAAQLTGRMTLPELQRWEARIEKAEKATKEADA